MTAQGPQRRGGIPPSASVGNMARHKREVAGDRALRAHCIGWQCRHHRQLDPRKCSRRSSGRITRPFTRIWLNQHLRTRSTSCSRARSFRPRSTDSPSRCRAIYFTESVRVSGNGVKEEDRAMPRADRTLASAIAAACPTVLPTNVRRKRCLWAIRLATPAPVATYRRRLTATAR